MVLAAQAKAQIEARYVMAERHPRDMDVVRERLRKECARPGFAQAARYHKPVGKGVDGWSIRFMETAIRLMGNVSIDTMTVYDDREKRIVRVMVTDCETNTPYSTDITMEKTVERSFVKDGEESLGSRTNSRGKLVHRVVATEDDLLNKQNALISKTIRTNGLRLLPADILEDCLVLVLQTRANEDAKDPDAARRNLFDAFNAVGVGVEQLKAYLKHDGATLTKQERETLRGLYSAIREGETTWKEVMDATKPEPVPEEKSAQSANDAIKARLASKSQDKRLEAQREEPKTQPYKPEEVWPKREAGE